MTDRDYLERALELAAEGRARTSPNPMVGAVLVNGGDIVGSGIHIYKHRDHAEILALREAGERARGATLYVNLEPCSHSGRTGPCTDALISAGVSRVVAAMEDPNPLVSGDGFGKLRAAGIAVEIDDSARSAAGALNEPFVHFMKTRRPLVTLKTALTLDGKIAAPDDNRGWLTSETARRHVQQLRHESDAMLTGIGTVLADDCLLTDRTGRERSRPLLRMVLDSQLRLPLTSRMVKQADGSVVVVTTSAASDERRKALESRGIRILTFDGRSGRTDIPRAIEWLSQQQILSVIVEAGSKVNWAILEAQAADKIFFYYAPKILGGTQSLSMAGGVGRRARSEAIRARDIKLHSISTDEFAVEGWLEKDWQV
jgi:diaminohydroxyphosphoribosylaminopyrimidine deaminase/5-amino-6-(5-phosphoribosylamino)uracil reductase